MITLKEHSRLRAKVSRMLDGVGIQGEKNKIGSYVAVEGVSMWLAELEGAFADAGLPDTAETLADIRGMLNRKEI